jgi:hypothetical protein
LREHYYATVGNSAACINKGIMGSGVLCKSMQRMRKEVQRLG